MSSEAGAAEIFKDVRYYAIGDLSEQTKTVLENGGAKEESYLSAIATHAIATDFDSVDLEEAQDCWQIPTVTERWVHLSSKCKKLLPPEGFTPSYTQLFSKLVFCPSQLSARDRDLVWSYATFYGGACQLMLNEKCTHLVVPQPEGAKYEEALKHPDIISIVTPDWILDSVKSKKLEDATKYHPTLIVKPEPVVPPTVPETQTSEQDVISSSLQSVNLSTTNGDNTVAAEQPPTITPAPQQAKQQIPPPFSASVPVTMQPVINRSMPSQQTNIVSQAQNISMPSIMMNDPTAQSNFTQAGQQYLITGQAPGKPQAMVMQQFQMQRQGVPTSVQQQRFNAPTVQQRFQSVPNQSQSDQKQSTAKKPKRRRSSTKAKAKSSNTTVPTTPIHSNQMAMMSQQQFMQQQNQQMMINPHRMQMMHQQGGQPGKVNYLPQQQMYQQQHFQTNMQGKPQVTSTSPQKQHIMGDQTGMRLYMPGTFQQGNMMHMQQAHQPRQVNQQMVPMAYNIQMQQQLAQQQMKMNTPAQQRTQMTLQQQPMMMAQNITMQNPMQGMNTAVKMQPRMQVPQQQQQQQQAMLIQQQQVNKDGLSPQQMQMPAQQQSPHKQQMQVVQQQNLTPQQRQHMMQQMHQRQLQMQQQQQQQQQQMMQVTGSMPPTPQKHPSPASSHASISVGGMGAISPTALHQGLMMAKAQQNSTFQQPLIHPSLQTPQDYGKGGTTKSRRSKSKKPKDGDENADGKAKPKPRSRSKKSAQSPATSLPGPKKLTQVPPGMVTVGGFYQQQPMNVMTPAQHANIPVEYAGNKHMFVTPNVTASPLASTENTYGQTPHGISHESTKVETRFLPQPTPTPPPPPRGPFIDPLESYPKSFHGKYHGHDPAENVPPELCLLGCVFVIAEYQDTVPDVKIIEHWKRIINKFGGIVEEDYNTCTCTHILCISQTSTLFKNALLEGKRCVTVYWLNDILLVRKLQPPWLSIHIPTPFAIFEKPATKHAISYTGFHQKERERIRMMASVCGCTISGCMTRSNTVLICKGTQSLKYDKAREWKIACANVHWLRDVLLGDSSAVSDPGQSKYQVFDENADDLFSLAEGRVQKILDSWKVPVRVTLDCMQRARVKRKNSIVESTLPTAKRIRTDGSYQSLPRVCFTGLPTKQVTELQKILESLQGQVSKNVSLSTHLVAERVSRTVKFLCAVSVCQYIVTPEWIEESAKSNWLLEEDKYLLNDKVAEERFEFSLEESLKKAKVKPLFKGYVFCITDNVVPDRKILAEIVECAGGKVIQKIPTVPMLKRLKSRQPPNNHLLVVSCPTDEHLVIKWKHEGIPVHNAEIILSGVLKQEVNETLYQL